MIDVIVALIALAAMAAHLILVATMIAIVKKDSDKYGEDYDAREDRLD